MSEVSLTDGAWPPTAVARAGALRLADMVQKSGRFVYAYWLGGGEIAGYNLLRHSGSVWAMADTANSLADLASVQIAARRALSWLLETKTVPLGQGLCLAGKDGKAKLGGAALATLACLEMNAARQDARLTDAATAFGTFMLMMRLPNGDFIHKVDIPNKKVLPFRSDYYTGEALFALARLYTVTQDTRWRDAAVASIRYLDGIDYGVTAQSHWMLYALDEISRAADTELCTRYGKRIADHILDQPDYRARNQSTPTACRSEGLLAFVRMAAEATDPAIVQTRTRATRAIEENLVQQLAFFDPSGAFVRGEGRDDVRIDFIQHNISSFLHYDRLVLNGVRAPA